MNQLKKLLPGILLCLLIAAPANILGKQIPLLGGPVFGILFGMLLSLFFPRILAIQLPLSGARTGEDNLRPAALFKLEDGVKYTSKKLLQYSIILLGFEMNLYRVIEVGGQSLFVMLFTLSTAFLTAFLVGKSLKLKGKMTTLIGVGTAICGGSAIAATAPVIQAEDEDVAHAISTIFLFNILAVFIFPAAGRMLGMSDIGFGLWAGTAINDTSSVVAAGASWSAAAGNNTALAYATIVKLTRTLMIVPITLILSIYMTRQAKRQAAAQTAGEAAAMNVEPGEPGKRGESTNAGTKPFSIAKVFPWFVLGFVVAAIIGTIGIVPASMAHQLVLIGKFMIVMAMSAIGLNTNLLKLLRNGIRPIAVGLATWAAVAGVSLLVQVILKQW